MIEVGHNLEAGPKKLELVDATVSLLTDMCVEFGAPVYYDPEALELEGYPANPILDEMTPNIFDLHSRTVEENEDYLLLGNGITGSILNDEEIPSLLKAKGFEKEAKSRYGCHGEVSVETEYPDGRVTVVYRFMTDGKVAYFNSRYPDENSDDISYREIFELWVALSEAKEVGF